MKNEKIVLKAIKKAFSSEEGYIDYLDRKVIMEGDEAMELFILSHEFSRAFWGDEWHSDKEGVECNNPRWMYHLSKLAVSKDRFKYLEKYL